MLRCLSIKNVQRIINKCCLPDFPQWHGKSRRIPIAKYATYSDHREKYMEVQDKWKEKDGVPKRWHLIYRLPMEKIIDIATTYLTISSSFIACGGVYYYGLTYNTPDFAKPIHLTDDVILANNGTEGLIYLGAFIALHFAIKLVLSRFVIRLYQDGDQYLAIFRGNFYNSVIKHEFELKDFHRLKPIMVLTWSDARFGLGKKHAILLEHYFKTPWHFNYLLYKKKINDNEIE